MDTMSRRLVVVGGDAAGMAAASQAKRRAGDDIDVIALERSHHVSYSACGIPYWVGGEVESADALVARTPEEHRERGIDLRMRHEVMAIDVDARQVTVNDVERASSYTLDFDELVIATGALPVRPDLPGVDARGIFGVQTLDDGDAVIEALLRDRPSTAVIVGGGYIGIEMAEAMVRKGLSVTVVDRDDALGGLDHAVDHPQRGGLATAGGADEDRDFAGRHLHGQAVDGLGAIGEPLRHVVETDHDPVTPFPVIRATLPGVLAGETAANRRTGS